MSERRYWDRNKRANVTNEKVDAFMSELFQLYQKYGMSVSHEDGHGGFIIERLSDRNVNWMKSAMLDLPEAGEEKKVPQIDDKFTYHINGDRYVYTVEDVITERRVLLKTSHDHRIITLRDDGRWREQGKDKRYGYYTHGDEGAHQVKEI